MRRVLLLALTVSGAIALAGCPKKPSEGECKSSEDCAAQEGYGKVCVEGRCQECSADAECREGFVCRENKCTPKPQCGSDADCGAGQACENERCVARQAGTCAGDRDCGPDQSCKDGQCVASGAGAGGEVAPACADAGSFTIRFGFDEASIAGSSQEPLQKLADCLKASPAKRVVVAGHADDRGTSQYNVALGSRRAEAARKYLGDLGVAAKVDTVSYGEEQPLCTDASEDCWSQNRRAEFKVER
jgi:peptidoglycan-associated lipoprotein